MTVILSFIVDSSLSTLKAVLFFKMYSSHGTVIYFGLISGNSCFEKRINIKKIMEWCLTRFSTAFQLYHSGQCTYPCFPGILLTSTPHNILPSHWLLSYITIVEITDSGERGMNPVAMSIINPRREYWPSLSSSPQRD